MSVGVGGNRKRRIPRPPDGRLREFCVATSPILQFLGTHGRYRLALVRRYGKPTLLYLRHD